MTDYAVCVACGTALASGTCNACARSNAAPAAFPTTAELHHTRFWQRFLVASIPATVLALCVESTLYGFVLYLGVYLTYCAWGEATRIPEHQGQTAAEWQPSTANG